MRMFRSSKKKNRSAGVTPAELLTDIPVAKASKSGAGKTQSFYIVATPIGNRDDISTRALQVLGDVQFIVAEDTRHTGQLLAYYGIKKPLISFRDAPAAAMKRSLEAVSQRLVKGQSGAYVTDAGTPNISDPGWRLVALILAKNIPVSPVPGASAVSTLISLIDVPLDEYRFIGFLPKKKGYQTKLDDLVAYLQSKESRGVVLYESPNRIRKTLTDLAAKSPDLQIVVGRELTKKFETVYRGHLTSDLVATLPEKGEYVVLVHNSESKFQN